MRKFLSSPRRPSAVVPEPSPPITPASTAASFTRYLEPPSEGNNLKYNPLRQEREFRVLVLLPGSGDDEIACILDNVFLDDWLTHYEALSYMWGPPEPSFPISVDGSTTYIRKNLLNALKHLRLPAESRLLFIDALCINRSDVPERNRMVANMSQIYQRATKVLIWLGDGDEVTDFAFDKINNRLPWADLSAPLERKTASTLTALFNRPYWRRLWVLQEILSGYNIEVFCGKKSAPWMQLVQIMRFIDAKIEKDPHDTAKLGSGFAKWCVNTPAMTILRLQNGQTPRQWTILELLETCRKCESDCYDVRDRIYGLVSICMQQSQPGCIKIEPDYSKTQAQLVVDAFLADFSATLGPNGDLAANQRTMQVLLEEPLWHPRSVFESLVTVIDEQQSHSLRNTFSKFPLRGASAVAWVSEPFTSGAYPRAQIDIETLYKKHAQLRLPNDIARVKNAVARLSVRDYHSTEQLRVRYAWSPQAGCFRTESTYRATAPPYFLSESTGEVRLFLTQNGVMGIASCSMQPADILCAVQCGGQDIWTIMRPRGDENRIGFRLIGRAVLLRMARESVASGGAEGLGIVVEGEELGGEEVMVGPEGLDDEFGIFRKFEAVVDAATMFFLTR